MLYYTKGVIFLEITTILTGQLAENCYLLQNNTQLLIMDPGDDSEKIIQEIKETKKEPVAILLTHSHIDHILGLPELLKIYDVPVYLSEKEEHWLEDPYYNLSQFFGQPFSFHRKTFPYEEHMTLGTFHFTTMKTPGHSIGGTTFYFKEDNMAIVGDTLFAGSIGRSDFPTGNGATLIKSIQEKLFSLPQDTKIYPGHGPSTTILKEMADNPFVGGQSVGE